MKNRLFTILFLLVLLIGLVFFSIQSSSPPALRTGFLRSTLNSGPNGLKALYLTLEKLGYPVERRRIDLTGLGEREGVFVMASFAPGESLTREEEDHLMRWIRSGRTLILLGKRFRTESRTRGLIDSLGLEPMEPDFRSIADIWIDSTGNQHSLKPSQPTEYTYGVSEMVTGTDSRWNTDHPRHVVHFSDGDGPFCISIRLGEGRIVAFADADFVDNSRIALKDNLRLILNVLSAESRGRICFDEFHQGFKETDTLWAYLANPPLGYLFLQVMIVGMVWLLGVSQRFGPVIPLEPFRRRSTLEHVEAVAAVYESARAHRLAVRGILHGFLGTAARSVGLGRGTDPKTIIEAVSGKYGFDTIELRQAVSDCEHLAARDRVRERDLVKACKKIARFEKQIRERVR